jgi:hypothetical protein
MLQGKQHYNNMNVNLGRRKRRIEERELKRRRRRPK